MPVQFKLVSGGYEYTLAKIGKKNQRWYRCRNQQCLGRGLYEKDIFHITREHSPIPHKAYPNYDKNLNESNQHMSSIQTLAPQLVFSRSPLQTLNMQNIISFMRHVQYKSNKNPTIDTVSQSCITSTETIVDNQAACSSSLTNTQNCLTSTDTIVDSQAACSSSLTNTPNCLTSNETIVDNQVACSSSLTNTQNCLTSTDTIVDSQVACSSSLTNIQSSRLDAEIMLEALQTIQNSSQTIMKFIPSQKKGFLLYFGGHLYQKVLSRSSATYYRCRCRECPAKGFYQLFDPKPM